jgi:hypothetical protein
MDLRLKLALRLGLRGLQQPLDRLDEPGPFNNGPESFLFGFPGGKTDHRHYRADNGQSQVKANDEENGCQPWDGQYPRERLMSGN